MKTIIFIQPRNHNNIKDFIEELSKKYIVELISYENNKFIQNKNIKYVKIKSIIISKNKQIYIPNLFQLWSLIKKEKIITIKNLNSLESFISLIICKIKKIKPIVFIQKINQPKNIILKKIHKKTYSYLLKKSTIISITKIGQEESKIFSKNSFFLPFGIKIINNIQKKKHNEINIICNAKIQKRKNILKLIIQFNKLIKKYKNIRLKIIARDIQDNEYYLEILNYIKENKLEKFIEIIIGIPLEEVYKIYMESDIYILTSYNEPAAYSHLEAMNYEIPVILNKYNGTSDYIKENKDGIIIKNKNLSEIYKALEKIISSDYQKMGKNAKTHLKKDYDIRSISRKFLEIVEK